MFQHSLCSILFYKCGILVCKGQNRLVHSFISVAVNACISNMNLKMWTKQNKIVYTGIYLNQFIVVNLLVFLVYNYGRKLRTNELNLSRLGQFNFFGFNFTAFFWVFFIGIFGRKLYRSICHVIYSYNMFHNFPIQIHSNRKLGT